MVDTGRFQKVGRIIDSWFTRLDKPDDPATGSSVVPGRPIAAVAAGTLPRFEGDFRSLLGRRSVQRYNPIKTLEMIRDYNPDASLAVWNFLRMVNPSHKITAKMLPDRVEVDEEGTALLRTRSDDLLGVYGRDYGGGAHALINVLTLTLLSQGALAGELEISEDLTDVLDWCPVDPRVIMFRVDDETGHFIPTMEHLGQSYVLPHEQFRFIPLDPAVGDPYGRSPLWPTLEATFFQVEVLRDLKMVAHTAGHPRMEVEVLEQIAQQRLPPKYLEPGQEENERAWLNAFLTDIASQYETLKPDDAFVHYDWVSPGVIDAGRPSYDLGALIKVVEHQVASALKHLPILLGRTEGQGLAHGTIQWQIFAQGIVALRATVSAMVSWWATQTLRIWGRQSVAVVEFPSVRTQDRLREAQAETLEVMTSIKKYFMGWVSNEELAEQHVGHPPVGEPDIPSLLGKPELALLAIGGEGEEEGSEEGAAEKALLLEQLEDALTSGDGNGRITEKIVAVIDAWNKRNGGDNYGATGTGSEVRYFDKLPVWMKSRLRSEKDSVKAFAAIRRDRIIDEFEEEE